LKDSGIFSLMMWDNISEGMSTNAMVLRDGQSTDCESFGRGGWIHIQNTRVLSNRNTLAEEPADFFA